MRRFVGGVLAATAVMYLYGFAYWGVSPLPYSAWKQAGDDERAGSDLLRHFPEKGTYYIPSRRLPMEEQERLYGQGPTAFVHILNTTGRPMMDPEPMIKGLVLYLVVSPILALILVKTKLPTYRQRVVLLALVGLTGALLIDIGDWAWWYIDLPWKLHVAAYNFSVVLLAGLVLAAFIRPKPGVEAGQK